MELTKQQIQVVNNYVEKNMNYIDLKLEVLDHMILDVENLMNKNFTFENAYKATLLKWNRLFKKENNFFYFGSVFTAPKIVMDTAIKSFRWYFVVYLLLYFSLLLSTRYLTLSIDKSSILYINTIVKIIVFISFSAFIYFQAVIRFSKIKTISSFIMKTQLFHGIFLLVPLLSQNYFHNNKNLFSFLFAWALIGIYIVIILFIFNKKHLKTVSKFSLK